MDHLPVRKRRSRCSQTRRTSKKERQEFLQKYSPLSVSTDEDAADSPKWVVLDPNGKQAYNWLGIVAIAVTYFYWSIPMRIAFDVEQIPWLWIAFDAVFYAVYAMDIAIQMRTSYLCDGILEQNIEKLYIFYAESTHSKIDLLSCLPLDWAYLLIFCTQPPPILHCVKLLKMYRVIQFIIRTESRSHYPNTCRFLILMHNLLVIIHWNACCYYTLSKWIGMGSDPWVYPTWNHTHNTEWGTLSKQYVYSFYWSTITLTTIGELSQPHTILEYAFMTLQYFIGIFMFATLVGNVGSIVSNVDKGRLEFQTKMDNIKTYMKATKVPVNIQERVIKWFDYLWSQGDPISEQKVLDGLPDKLKAEIGLHVHFETLKKVDFFKECEQGLLWEVVLRLRKQVYSPGEFVCRKGDVGREMYIVNSGKLEVLEEENGILLRELTHGEYFGEISVLNQGLGKSHRRRTAFVRSVGYTSLLCLTQTDLLEVLNDYPKTMTMLVDNCKMKLRLTLSSQNYESDTSEELHAPAILGEEAILERPSSDSNCSIPRTQLSTLTDEVAALKDRLTHIESLIVTVLTELEHNNSPHICNSTKPKEQVRKLSV
jgi:CRP-like cAMP-binding protein